MDTQSMLMASDTARMQAGGRSMFEKMYDAATAGTAGATMSALASFYNTGVSVANLFGAKAEEMDTGEVLKRIDHKWADYYEENKAPLDTIGFIGGAFIPGGIALKGLQLARTGKAFGTVGRALGYTVNQQNKYLQLALKDIASEGGTVFARINANKLISMAYGVADNALQAAVFETAASLTMAKSPMLAEEDWKDISWDILKSSLVGGAIGGAVEGLITNRIYKNAGKSIEGLSRKYDTIVPAAHTSMEFGDRAFNLVDELYKLPTEVLQEDKLYKYTYKLGTRSHSIDLDLSNMLDRKLRTTAEKGLNTLQAELTNFVKSDTTVGGPLGKAVLETVRDGMKAGASKEEIKKTIGDLLFGLKSVGHIGDEAVDVSKDVFYLAKNAALKGEPSTYSSLFAPIRNADTDRAYRVIGDINQAKLGTLGVNVNSVQEAKELGIDLLIHGESGRMTINPESKIFQRVDKMDADKMKVLYNVRTKQSVDTALPTIGDVATAASPIKPIANGITSGQKVFNFTVGALNRTDDTVEITARHAWASGLKTKLANVAVHADDYSVLDAMVANPTLIGENVTIKFADGTSRTMKEIGNLRAFVLQQKLSDARETYNAINLAKEEVARIGQEGKKVHSDLMRKAQDIDPRTLAYKLNVEVKWLQDAAIHEFNGAKLDDALAFRPLDSYLERENLSLTYDRAIHHRVMNGDFASSYVDFNYRKQVAAKKNNEAFAAVMRDNADKFVDFSSSQLTRKADATGTGATGFGFADADYNDPLRVFSLDTGKNVHLVSQQRVNEVVGRLQPLGMKLIANPRNGAEASAILARGRLSDTPLSLLEHEGKFLLVDKASKDALLKAVAAGEDVSSVSFATRVEMSEDVYRFWKEHMDIRARQILDHTHLANAQGQTIQWNPDILYFPPIDTKKVPYFAFVKNPDGKLFSTSEVAMITARTPEELNQLIAGIPKELQVIKKDGSELYHKALGDYEYLRTLNSPSIDPMLRKQGKLGNYLPSLDPKGMIEDVLQFHMRQEQRLVRDAVTVRYADTFSELEWLSQDAVSSATSKFQRVSDLLTKRVADPYGDIIKTALDVSKRTEFTLWHQMNEFVDAVGTRAYRMVEDGYAKAQKGIISWQEGNDILKKYGLGTPFTEDNFVAAQFSHDRNLIKNIVYKANMLLSTFGLRFDVANSLINVVSTPILLSSEVSAIKEAMKADPALLAKFGELTSVAVPGMPQTRMPSTMKLLYNATSSYATPQGKALIDRFKDIGVIKDVLAQHHDMMQDLASVPTMVPGKASQTMSKWTEKIATATGNNFSEEFTRYVSAHTMLQLTDPAVAAGRMSVKEQNALINIFVNRVQGNYIASQRPIAFQGTVGAAIGLFQTYQFNLFQRLFSHIGNRDAKSIAVMGALQTSLFGLNGLPLFDALNTYLIGQANINEGHHDAYSFAVQAAGKELGDWALYGSLSAFPMFSDKMPSLYTRGDLNPRHVSIIPTSFTQIPAVETSMRVVSNLVNMAQMLGNGGDVLPSLLFGLEHNGVNRPLAGIAQVAQGFSTTSQNSLISASSDFSAIVTSARLLGAKPMDEAVTLSEKYRTEAYKAADRARIEDLGKVVKQKIRSGSLEDSDLYELQSRYAALGGRIEGFKAALQRWTKDANQSVINTLANYSRSQYGQRMDMIMGGDRIEDYWNSPE